MAVRANCALDQSIVEMSMSNRIIFVFFKVLFCLLSEWIHNLHVETQGLLILENQGRRIFLILQIL